MNSYFAAAGVLTFVIGFVHSIFGERLIFRRMRVHGLVPTHGGPLLLERHVRILWATWHLVTVLGWSIAVILLWLAQPDTAHLAKSALSYALVVALAGSSAVVLIGTRGRHPGWLGLLAAAIIAAVGIYS